MCKSVSIDHYLKTIYRLQRQTGAVRNIDIAAALGYSKPSVTRAVAVLEELGYAVSADRLIRLTPAGEREAESLLERYETVRGFLAALGVSADSAARDACQLEHSLSDETYEKIRSARKG